MRFLCLAWLWPAVVFAQATDVEVAKQHYQTGQLHYERGEFDKALASFQEAYRLAQRPELQYNIAQAHERLLMIEEAVAAYRAYLEGKPDAPDRKFVESRIEFLEKQLAERNAAAAPLPPAPAPVIEPQPAPTPEPAIAPAPTPVTETVTVTPAPAGEWKRTAGWVSLGVGGAAAVVGVLFGLKAKGLQSDLEEANDNGKSWEDSQSLQNDGETAELLQITGLAVGGVGLVAGAILLWTAPATTTKHVGVGPSGIRVSF